MIFITIICNISIIMIIETITVYNIKIIVVVVKVELMEVMVTIAKEVEIKEVDDDKVHFLSVKNGQVTNFSCHEINTSDHVK